MTTKKAKKKNTLGVTVLRYCVLRHRSVKRTGGREILDEAVCFVVFYYIDDNFIILHTG